MHTHTHTRSHQLSDNVVFQHGTAESLNFGQPSKKICYPLKQLSQRKRLSSGIETIH